MRNMRNFPAKQIVRRRLPADRADDVLPDGAIARLGTLELRKGYPGILRLAPDGKTFLTLDNSRTLRKWDTRTGRVLQIHRFPPANTSPASESVFTHDGKGLIARSPRGFDLFDTPNYQLSAHCPWMRTGLPRRRFTRRSDFCGIGKLRRPWRFATLGLANGLSRVVGEHKGGLIIAVAFTPDSKRIVTVDGLGTHCWDMLPTSPFWHNGERNSERLIFLPDGKSFLGVHFPNNAVRRWDANSGKPIDDAKLRWNPNSSFSLRPTARRWPLSLTRKASVFGT